MTHRKFSPAEHLVHVREGDWVPLRDEDGRPLPGIRGRSGAAAETGGGKTLGADLIEMQPGTAFPLHAHPGDHILYILEGAGVLHVDGTDHPLRPGDTVFIPAEYPHGVRAGAEEPLVFLAVGHPHRRLDAADRMHAP